MRWAGCLANINADIEAYKISVGKPVRKGYFGSTSSADERGVKPVKITRPGGPEKTARGLTVLHMLLSFFVVSLFVDCTD
jgi:hypothetical protein